MAAIVNAAVVVVVVVGVVVVSVVVVGDVVNYFLIAGKKVCGGKNRLESWTFHLDET